MHCWQSAWWQKGRKHLPSRCANLLDSCLRLSPQVVNQVELHPLLSQRKLVGTCARKVQ